MSDINLDGWANILTGLGTSRDSVESSYFNRTLLQEVQVRDLWLGNDLAAKIIEVYPRESLRQGFKVVLDNDKASEERINDAVAAFGVSRIVTKAMEFERAFGGAGIVLIYKDGRDMSEPVGQGVLSHAMVASTIQLTPIEWYSDIEDPKYNTPAIYDFDPSTANFASVIRRVHGSRVIRLPGLEADGREFRNRRWGASVLERCYNVLRDFGVSFGSLPPLLKDFAQAVFTLKGLSELVGSTDEKLIADRFKTMDMARSVLRAVVLDEGETFQRITTPLSGMAELLDRLSYRLASAAGIPATKLFGESPNGMNATGASDTMHFYDSLKCDQETKIKPMINTIVSLLINDPTVDFSIEFPSLWQSSELEQVQVRKAQSEVDSAYIDRGVLSPSEVAISRFGGKTYSVDTALGVDRNEILGSGFDQSQSVARAKEAYAQTATSAGTGSDRP